MKKNKIKKMTTTSGRHVDVSLTCFISHPSQFSGKIICISSLACVMLSLFFFSSYSSLRRFVVRCIRIPSIVNFSFFLFILHTYRSRLEGSQLCITLTIEGTKNIGREREGEQARHTTSTDE